MGTARTEFPNGLANLLNPRNLLCHLAQFTNNCLGFHAVNGAAELRALLISEDPSLEASFRDVLRTFGVEARKNAHHDGPAAELRTGKFEALVVDFDTVSGTQPLLTAVRDSPSNRHALVFAVATGAVNRKNALQQGVNFVFERPLATAEVRQVLRRSYNLMVRERRRYFRCAAEIPVVIRCSSGAETQGTTFNLSSTGLAASLSSSFNLGQEVQVALSLDKSGPRITAAGKVVWDDKHGKTGFQVRYSSAEMQHQVDTWLDARFAEILGKPCGGDV